jgi:hypothetical protein
MRRPKIITYIVAALALPGMNNMAMLPPRPRGRRTP